jgi:hypothetical protein
MDELFELPADIYVDGIGAAYMLGRECFRTIYFAWVRLPGMSVLQKRPVISLVRPVSALDPGILERLINAPPADECRPPLHS